MKLVVVAAKPTRHLVVSVDGAYAAAARSRMRRLHGLGLLSGTMELRLDWFLGVDGLRGIDREPSDQPTHVQEVADASVAPGAWFLRQPVVVWL